MIHCLFDVVKYYLPVILKLTSGTCTSYRVPSAALCSYSGATHSREVGYHSNHTQ